MNQLPIFVTLKDCKVILVGEGEAADAKRRLIERAGGICVGAEDHEAKLAFVATDDFEAIAAELKARRLLVNVVDQPHLCEFTTPAIIDRDPVLIAIGTGGASAGLAKALRQRLEQLLPDNLGQLAQSLSEARSRIRGIWPDNAARRKAIDDALSEAGILDPLAQKADDAVDLWLNDPANGVANLFSILKLTSSDPDDLTLKQARLLGQADQIYHDSAVPIAILNRARADAERHECAPPDNLPSGVTLYLQLQNNDDRGNAVS